MTLKEKTFLQNFARPRMGRRLIAVAAGLLAMGTAVAVFKTIGFGTDPCSTFTLGVAAHTGISFGTCQLLINLLLFLPVLRYDLSRIGIGTVGNMVGIGYTADFCLFWIGRWLPEGGLSLPVRLTLFVLTTMLFLLGISFYTVADLGVAPYDAIPQLIAARTKKISFRAARVLWDLLYLSAGFLLGSTVGLTTVVIAFCLGPMVAAVSARVRHWFE